MATIKSISGLVFYVTDKEVSKKFYEDLGFRFGTPKGNYLTAYINWFWIEIKEGTPQGGNAQISVDNVDEFYKELKSKGFNPDSQPNDIIEGRREFVLSDPDDYKLVFFTKG